MCVWVSVCLCVCGIYKLTATANESSLQLHRTQVEKYLIQLKASHTQTGRREKGRGTGKWGSVERKLKQSWSNRCTKDSRQLSMLSSSSSSPTQLSILSAAKRRLPLDQQGSSPSLYLSLSPSFKSNAYNSSHLVCRGKEGGRLERYGSSTGIQTEQRQKNQQLGRRMLDYR